MEAASPRPASGAFTVSGRGFGHGRGMSQWGAHGAADAGLDWTRILDFYYPGTTRASVGDSTIRVWLSADTDGDTQVLPAPGLAATVGNTRRLLPTGPGYTAWRAVPSGGAVSLQYRGASGGWSAYALGSGPSISFSTTSGTARVLLPGGTTKEVRGTVSSVADATGPRGLRTVLNSTMQSYLRSVVPNEMPPSWHTEALTAQSVAARTYAASYRHNQRAKGATWDICDTVTCQVFKGVATYDAKGTRHPGEHARTDAAITTSSGVVMRTRAGNFAHAEFSSSNGGWSVAGGPSYQGAKADPYDGRLRHSHTSWSVPITTTAIEKAYNVGALRSVRITKRDGNGPLGGRVVGMDIIGSSGTKSVTGADFRTKLKLKSAWFTLDAGTPTAAPAPPAAPVPKATPIPKATPTAGGAAIARRSLITTDAAGGLWMRPPSGTGFGTAKRIGTHWHTMDTLLSVGNWDGTGGDDLVARQKSTGRLLLYSGDGSGALRNPRAISGNVSHLSSLASVGDFDKDGHPDLTAVDPRSSSIVLLRGGPSLSAPVKLSSPRALSRVNGVGDLNRDGNADIGWTDVTGRAHVILGNGRGGALRTVTMGRGWDQFSNVFSAGDVGGDGVDDVFALHRDGTLYRYNGNGRGGLGGRSVVLTGVRPVLVAR